MHMSPTRVKIDHQGKQAWVIELSDHGTTESYCTRRHRTRPWRSGRWHWSASTPSTIWISKEIRSGSPGPMVLSPRHQSPGPSPLNPAGRHNPYPSIQHMPKLENLSTEPQTLSEFQHGPPRGRPHSMNVTITLLLRSHSKSHSKSTITGSTQNPLGKLRWFYRLLLVWLMEIQDWLRSRTVWKLTRPAARLSTPSHFWNAWWTKSRGPIDGREIPRTHSNVCSRISISIQREDESWATSRRKVIVFSVRL